MADWNKCFDENGLNLTNFTNGSSSSEDQCPEKKQQLTDLDLIDSCLTTRAKRSVTRNGMNILGIITFTIAFSFALSSLGRPGQEIVRAIAVLNEAIMKLVMAVMW